jgi:hypothetical protein
MQKEKVGWRERFADSMFAEGEDGELAMKFMAFFYSSDRKLT